MNSHFPLTIEQERRRQLIMRYEERLRKVYSNVNPYIKNPFWQATEIKKKIKELKNMKP